MKKKLLSLLSVVLCMGIVCAGCGNNKKIEENELYNTSTDSQFEVLAIEDAIFEVPTAVMQDSAAEYSVKAHWISISAPEYEIYAQEWEEDLSTTADADEAAAFIENAMSFLPLELGEAKENRSGDEIKMIFECEKDGKKGYFSYLKKGEKSFYIYAVTDEQFIKLPHCEYMVKSLQSVPDNISTCETKKYADLDKDAPKVKNAQSSEKDGVTKIGNLGTMTVGNDYLGYLDIPFYFVSSHPDEDYVAYVNDNGCTIIMQDINSSLTFREIFDAWEEVAGDGNVKRVAIELDEYTGVEWVNALQVSTPGESILVVYLEYVDGEILGNGEKRILEYHAPAGKYSEDEANCFKSYKCAK